MQTKTFSLENINLHRINMKNKKIDQEPNTADNPFSLLQPYQTKFGCPTSERKPTKLWLDIENIPTTHTCDIHI